MKILGNSSAEPPPRAWLTVGLLWFVAFFNYLARVMLTTMHGSVLSAIPMTEAQFGLLTSIFLWVYGLLSPLAGFASDRFSRKWVITFSLFFWSVITWLTAYAKTFEELLIMRALMAVSEASYLPAALSLITDYHQGPTRSFAVGLHMTGVVAGYAMAGMGGWLAQHRTWGYAFALVGAVGIGYSAVLALALKDRPRAADGPERVPIPQIRFRRALADLLRSRSFLLIFLCLGLLGAVTWVVLSWMPTFVQERFHLGQGAAGLSATGFLNCAALLGMLCGGAWADRWSRTQPRARIFVTVIGFCAAAPGVLLTARADSILFAVFGLVIYGFTVCFSDSNMMPILCQVSDPRYRATGYGLLNMASTLAGGLAVYAAGALRDLRFDFGRILDGAVLGLILCALILLPLRPRSPAIRPLAAFP